MVTKVIIKDNQKCPIDYITELKNFKNGKEYEFKTGVNVIVGENGSGKTTLLNLIRAYLLVDLSECSAGTYNCNINKLFPNPFDHKEILDGVDVFADYQRNTFRLCHAGERKHNDEIFEDDISSSQFLDQNWSSTGEGVIIALSALFKRIFSKNARLTFDYLQFKDNYMEYMKYIHDHVISGDEWTILMDEPDRNLSIDNIGQIECILNVHKKHTQIIAVIHNPLIIYALSKNPEVNFIEMTKGYVKKVVKEVNRIMKR